MTYDFNSRKRDFGKIIFALTLDRKKLTERIIIARSDEARLRLDFGTGDVYFDETRPLGSLTVNFKEDKSKGDNKEDIKRDKSGEWNKTAAILRESYGKAIPRQATRWKAAEPAAD